MISAQRELGLIKLYCIVLCVLYCICYGARSDARVQELSRPGRHLRDL